MNSFPFESKNIGTASSPVYDRAITAEIERNFNMMCYTNGVFAAPANGLMVSAAGGFKVKINPGGCHINGARGYEANLREITLAAASATLPRIDRVLIRFDTADDKRNIEIYLKEGVPATTPSPQSLIRESNYYEIALADIYVPKGATEITNSDITDRRLDPSVCGLVVPAIPYENQTAALWQQIKDSIDLVNAALNGTIAGNLQTQINANKSNITIVETLVNTLNTLLTPALGIARGGTGATTKEQAMVNLGVSDYIIESGTVTISASITLKYNKFNSGRVTGKLVCTSSLTFAAGFGPSQIGSNITVSLPATGQPFKTINDAFLRSNTTGLWGGGTTVTGLQLSARMYGPSATTVTATYTFDLEGTWK